VAEAAATTQEPTATQRLTDKVFRRGCQACAGLILLLVLFIVVRIALAAVPAIREHGIGFLTGTTWDPNQGRFAILPEIWGTLYTSLLALLFGSVFGIAAAIYLSEGFLGQLTYDVLKKLHLELNPVFLRLPAKLEGMLKNLVELLAAIPSVVYGLWGLFVVIPRIRPVCGWLNAKLSFIPSFPRRSPAQVSCPRRSCSRS